MITIITRDPQYLEILLNPLQECSLYKPAFGHNSADGVNIELFRELYGSDPLYHWVGLDSDLMYAAHKAAGGMTSIYRQLGIGCERLLRRIIQDEYGLSNSQVSWSYSYDKGDGRLAIHTLDACIRSSDIRDELKKSIYKKWLTSTAERIGYSRFNAVSLNGAVFEIRQGYKSADSKRQNADLRFGMRAISDSSLLPVITIVSTQVSETVIRRYRDQRILIMLGELMGDNSTFGFFSNVIGYNLADFLVRNSQYIRSKFELYISQLLQP